MATSSTVYGDVPNPNLLFHNRGGGQFDKIVFEAKPPGTGSSTSASWCDFDNDGDLDLFVTNGGWVGVQRSALYRNDSNAFTRLTNAIPPDSGRSESSAWGDYDNDGYPDLFVANITSREGGKNFLYHNSSDGTFTRIKAGAIAEDAADGIGCAWADFDNAGYLDLVVANGEYSLQRNFLYHNNGDGTFSRVATSTVGADSGASAGCAWGDYDNDGFVDLFVSNFFGGSGQPPQRNFLYRNIGNSNAWLNVKLVGTVSNRSAIGAKVRVKATIGDRTMWQLREVSGGSGFGSQNDMRANFGLGGTTNVDTVRIEWPSGTVQELHDVTPKQFLTITEPPRLLASKTNGIPQFTLEGGRFMTYDIQTSTNLNDWLSGSSVTVTNMSRTVPIELPVPPDNSQRFYRALAR